MKTIFTIICLLSVFIASAQWTSDTEANTLVAEPGELDMLANGTSDGQTYVVFWKSVEAPVFMELRLQILNEDGIQKFGDEGILISNQIPMGSFSVIMTTTVDANDNLYIGVTGTDGGDPAFVFKIDTDGNQLWDDTEVNIGSGHVVTVLPLSTGEVIVSWLGASGAIMQKFDENGHPIWPTTKPIELVGSTTSPANIFEISDNNYIVVFHKLLFGINSYLYAQRYDADGNPVWENPIQLADRTTSFNQSYTGLQDNDVIYMAYYASIGTRFDSYLQRINPDGTLPWGINGSDFDINETNNEMETNIAFEFGSQNIWAVATYSDSNQNEKGEYVQKFDKDSGERLLTENAKALFPIGSEKVHAGSLQLKDGLPFFLIKDGFDNGTTPVSLRATHLDENGNFIWQEETLPVATFPANKSRIQFTKQVNHQSVAVFIEDKGEGGKIYAQNIIHEIIGIQDFSEVNIFFTNPISNEMRITSNSAIKEIAIYNVLGQHLFSSKYNSERILSLNTQSWNEGIYFMSISTENGIQKGIKLVKQ